MHELRLSKEVLKNTNFLFQCKFRTRIVVLLYNRSGERLVYMHIKRAVTASTDPFQTTSSRKLICMKGGEVRARSVQWCHLLFTSVNCT